MDRVYSRKDFNVFLSDSYSKYLIKVHENNQKTIEKLKENKEISNFIENQLSPILTKIFNAKKITKKEQDILNEYDSKLKPKYLEITKEEFLQSNMQNLILDYFIDNNQEFNSTSVANKLSKYGNDLSILDFKNSNLKAFEEIKNSIYQNNKNIFYLAKISLDLKTKITFAQAYNTILNFFIKNRIHIKLISSSLLLSHFRNAHMSITDGTVFEQFPYLVDCEVLVIENLSEIAIIKNVTEPYLLDLLKTRSENNKITILTGSTYLNLAQIVENSESIKNFLLDDNICTSGYAN